MAEFDQLPFKLPEYLNAIAADIRQRTLNENHRPKEKAARRVVQNLTNVFQLAVEKPLYEYAGLLTKSCFPEEWNPAGGCERSSEEANHAATKVAMKVMGNV